MFLVVLLSVCEVLLKELLSTLGFVKQLEWLASLTQ